MREKVAIKLRGASQQREVKDELGRQGVDFMRDGAYDLLVRLTPRQESQLRRNCGRLVICNYDD